MFSQKKVLVVEDNEINRMMLNEILSAEYEVLEAENGQEAMETVLRYGEGISLILLDLNMPVMDGYTFLSIMKADTQYSSIPVIVTTQSDGESDEVTALSHGASDFVTKPYNPQVILHRVAGIINLRETAAMVNLVKYDRLTGLYSKEFFYKRIRDTLLQYPEKQFDIVCSDIENFKLVNDIFGIPAGDHLLRGIAGLYREYVNDKGICGRLNSDQFACMVERPRDYVDEYFIKATAEVNNLADVKNLVMKWGIYAVEDRGISAEQMCDRAILAVRSIKGQYGKYFARYDDHLRSRLLREQAITDGMETALAEKQFLVYLQPKYHIKDGVLSGAEALVRWNHPKWGFQSPDDFIPLFEKNGFITKLDQYVWESACAILKNWDERGLPPISVSVNVSRADIYNADLVNILLAIINKYGISAGRLHLEITESAYTENPSQIIDTVARLREEGFVIEMDDFGSGYSSLNMLNNMPIDILKLDMKFIQSETEKPVSQGILQFIINLARWMNLYVIAEGVETKEQLDRLREIGCDYVQGYYFAKPMPAEEFEHLLIQGRAAIPPEPEKEEDGTWRKTRTLLLADEDGQYRKKVKDALESRYRVVEAVTCEQAFGRLSDYEGKISLAVLSLTLPDEGGYRLLESLNRQKTLWDIPVIASAPSDPDTEERALELGADDFIGKPYHVKSLQYRIARLAGIRASREQERLLRDVAYRDYLTGLLNRRGLEAALDTVGKEDTPLAVYVFDLDNLKQRNDTCGHLEGDQLIARFSSVLRANTRSNDILARFGGDEFIAVIRRIRSADNALKKGEEICSAIRGREGDAGEVSCSAGAALMEEGDRLQDVIEKADQALYRAKAEKKGGCCLWKG